MTIAVTGAAGHIGRLTISALRARGIAATDIVAVVRDAAKAADLAVDGVQVRVANYADATALREALADVDKLLLVSGSEVGQRLPQHTNIIEAAKTTGVTFIAYTSILHAATSPLILAGEHKATEELLAASGIDHALLRNGWYWENYDNSVAAATATGALFGSAGTGRVAGAARKDFAEAAAAVLATEGHAGAVYELGGQRLTYTELAEVLSGIVGVPVTYKDLPKEEYAKILENAGVPTQFAAVLADSDAGIAVGALDTDSGDLERLIGRPATPAAEAIGA
ncbi:SDR family oxidoreductase [Rhodococcus sp. B50]|uniref:SDR family oxidoreductase n=1 Tax=Rhodococcus sp. B50 TaxID=2682847 RepID=UPI001BD4E93F|nr:SDR family oxidoreductase [Rhodococcus sp. B50]MBS9372023.1 Quinone oxidoreductase 2 [Rhodococcus sp. B50]